MGEGGGRVDGGGAGEDAAEGEGERGDGRMTGLRRSIQRFNGGRRFSAAARSGARRRLKGD